MSQKIYQRRRTAAEEEILSQLLRAFRDTGYANIGTALEYSPQWFSKFLADDASLTLEGIARLLAAAGLMLAGKSESQLVVDELAAMSIRQNIDRATRKATSGHRNYLSDDELAMLLQLALWGSRAFFERVTVRNSPDDRHEAPQPISALAPRWRRRNHVA